MFWVYGVSYEGMNFGDYNMFEIVRAYPLPFPVPLEQSRVASFFFNLPHGTSMRLCEQFEATVPICRDCVASQVAPVCVQLPCIYSKLISNGLWTGMCIPRGHTQQGGRRHGMAVGWQFLPRDMRDEFAILRERAPPSTAGH